MSLMSYSEPAQKDGVIICPRCGAENPDYAKFCVKCGYNLLLAKGGKISEATIKIVFFTSIVSLLDFLLNTGILKAAAANSMLGILEILSIISSIVIFYIWYKYRGIGLSFSDTYFKIFMVMLLILFLSYLSYYIIFILVGVITVSPLWILYGYVLRSIYRKYKET